MRNEQEQIAQRAEQIAAFLADRRNGDLIELGARVRDEIVAENGPGSVEWRAGIVAGKAWNAQHRH
jgi:hypothetical protein